VHPLQPAGGDADLFARALEDRGIERALGLERLGLEGFDSLERVLVEDQRQAEPDERTEQDQDRAADGGAVGAEQAVEEQRNTKRQLQKQPEDADGGCPAIGQVVIAHASLGWAAPRWPETGRMRVLGRGSGQGLPRGRVERAGG
jgi:hypothetical protein